MEVSIQLVSHPEQRFFSGVRDLLNQLYPNLGPIGLEKFQQVLDGGNAEIYIAENGAKIIGTASLVCYEKLGGRVCVVEDVVVDAKYRGLGVGRKLTERLIESAVRRGAPFIDVVTRRPEAKKFYLKFGFKDKSEDRSFYALRKYL